MKFKAKKDPSTACIFFGTVLILVAVSLWTILVKESFNLLDLLMIICMTAVCVVLIWFWFNTFYEIKGKNLLLISGPFRKSISISDIYKISPCDYLFAGYKPALARGGIVFHYHKWNEVYICPDDIEAFSQAIQSINSDVVLNQS